VGGDGFAPGEGFADFSGGLDRSAGQDVGSYTIASTYANSNYQIDNRTGTLTITRRPLVAVAQSIGKTYGENDPVLPYDLLSGGQPYSLPYGDILGGRLGRAPGDLRGKYAVNAGDLAASANYDFSINLNGAELTIYPRALRVYPDSKTITFGNADPVFSYTVGPGDLVGSDELSGNLGRQSSSNGNAGTYPITLGTLQVVPAAHASSYTIDLQPASLTIEKAFLTPTISGNLNPVYDGTAKSVTAATSPATSIQITYGGSSSAPVNAGTYAVVAEVQDVNYQGSASATLVIDKALPVVAVTAGSYTYNGNPQGPQNADVNTGGSPGTVNLQYSGTPNDGSTFFGSATAPTLAGSYTVVATVAEDANYLQASSPATSFQILRASTTIQVTGSATFTYNTQGQGPDTATVDGSAGGSLGTVTYSYEGTGGTSYGATGAKPVDVGSYQVTATVAQDGNHEGAVSAPFAFAIEKAPQSILFANLGTRYLDEGAISLEALADSGLNVSYASSRPEVAQVIGKTLILKTTGQVTVTARQWGDGNWEAAADADSTLTIVARDSDNDGVPDSIELADGTDPNDASSLKDINRGLVAYYPFNGDANDASGNGFHGTIFNGATPTSDRLGNAGAAFSFNGIDQYIGYPKFGLTGARTFSGWVKLPADIQPYRTATILGQMLPPPNSPHERWAYHVDSNNLTYYHQRGFHGGVGVSSVPTPPSSSGWNHFVAVADPAGPAGQKVSMYLNGRLVGKLADYVADELDTGYDSMRVLHSDTDLRHNEGDLDQVRVYNRALTPNEVAALYVEEAGTMDSDGDSLTDTREVGFGRYQIVPGNFTWDQAKADAESKNGHLATFTSEDEWKLAWLILASAWDGKNYWLGGNDRAQEGVWSWVTGENWSYERWVPGQPSGAPENELISWINLTDGMPGWNDGIGDALPGSFGGYVLEFGYPTDPFAADSDGDGFNDNVESLEAIDPNNPLATPKPVLTLARGALSGTVDLAIGSLQASATGPDPILFSASNLPSGLTIDEATGLISGTPVAAGAGTASVMASNSYGVTAVDLPWTVAKGASTIGVTGTTQFTYSGSPQGPATADRTGSGGAVSYLYEGRNTTVYSNTTPPIGAGDYLVTATLAADDNYEEVTSAPLDFHIAKAGSTLAVTGATSFTYNGSPQGPDSHSATGSTGAVTFAYTGTGSTFYSGNTPPTGAGTYEAVATLADDDNHHGVSSAAYAFTIDKAVQTITFDPLSDKVYGDPDFNLGATASSNLLVTYESLFPEVVTVTGNTVSVVGAGLAAIRATQDGDDNHLSAAAVVQQFTVTRQDVGATIGWTGDFNPVYDNSAKAVSAASTPATTVNVTYNGSVVAPKDAGTYEVVATIADANYQGSATNTLTIGRRAVEVRANERLKTYGQPDPRLTYSHSPLAPGESTLAGTLGRQPGEGVGSYSITLGDMETANPNYQITLVSNQLRIDKRHITVSSASLTKRSGDPDPAFAARVVLGGSLRDGDQFSGSFTRTDAANENPGFYPLNPASSTNLEIRRGTEDMTANYEIEFDLAGLGLTIDTATLLKILYVLEAPTFDPATQKTTVSVRLLGEANRSYQVETRTHLVQGSWTPLGTFATGTEGEFDVALEMDGNQVAALERQLFFRAKRVNP